MDNVSRPTILFIVCAFALSVAFFYWLPVTYADWMIYFQPAAADWLHPYRYGIFNPPWLFPLLFPMALLPTRLGAAFLMSISVAIVMFYLQSPIKSALALTSAPMIVLFTLGQIDALSLAALLVAPALGLPLLIIKPQGAMLAMLPRLGRLTLLALAGVLLISLLVWGFWPLDIDRSAPTGRAHDVSPFPYAVPLTIPLAWFGYRRRSDALLCWASLCLSPYWMITSMLPALAASLKECRDWRVWLALWAGGWAYLFMAKLIL